MATLPMQQQLAGFARWKQRQRKLLDQFEPWLQRQELYSPEIHHAIGRARSALRDDCATVAVVGEFSRGKTELINALFFSDLGFRMLPTDAGRTTMCPTEILQDPEHEPCLRLLPIETRAKDVSLYHLRHKAEAWSNIPLNLADPDALEEQLKALTSTKRVSLAEATALGLHPNDPGGAERAEGDGALEIPRWRLAQLNIRHPLLAKGLRVIDTPGLNAVGNEPELTYEILPNAQAVLFVLSADTGVTRSDLKIWQQLVNPDGMQRKGVMVILNKIDSLWDELRPPQQIEARIQQQRLDVANLLEVTQDQTFAVSAQKALLSRIRSDPDLERRSGIAELEDYLSRSVVENRRDLLMHSFTDDVQRAIDSLRNIIQSRQVRIAKQIHNLQQVNGRSDSSVAPVLEHLEQERKRYHRSVDTYRDSRREFRQHGETLLEALDLHALDQAIAEARSGMSNAWTTAGLKRAMRVLFDDISMRMDIVAERAQLMRRLIRTIYLRFHTEHEFPPLEPAMFSVTSHQIHLDLLRREAELFRNSARTTMTEKHFVVQRYFRTIVDRAHRIFREAHREAHEWLDRALDPLTIEVREYRSTLSQQILDLKHAGQSRKTTHQRILQMEREARRMQTQLTSLQNVHQALGNTAIPDARGRIKPRVVGGLDSRTA